MRQASTPDPVARPGEGLAESQDDFTRTWVDDLRRDIVVIGASAGGFEALRDLLGALPFGLGAAVLIVLHTSPDSPGNTADILERVGRLPVVHPQDGDDIVHGCVMVAPPDQHMVVDGSKVRLVRGPKENGVRPAVDPLFRSAVRSYGPRVVGVLLSGSLDDGTQGLSEIKQGGGLAVVQDPREASFPCMPLSGLRHVPVDQVLSVKGIAELLIRLGDAGSDDLETAESLLPSDEAPDPEALQGVHNTAPAAFTCPECGGALRDASKEGVVRFQCHVGHAYNADSLVAEHTVMLEQALWTALRTLEEAACLRREMAQRSYARGLHRLEEAYLGQAREFERRATLIRAVFEREGFPGAGLGRMRADAPEVS
ncbi:MAG TPA: chemotaxis protein CheB [Myxococcota bacterium]|nr:chemotaxis protein CheB [Myxococcota bacterium]